MKTHYQTILVSIVFLFTYASLTAVGQVKNVPTFNSPIQYRVINDKRDSKLTDADVERRRMDILISPQNFTKPKLERFFDYLSKRFLHPNILLINVYSHSDDILKKGELQPIPHISKSSYTVKGDIAIFTRTKDERHFLLYFKDGDFDEVQMK